MKIRITSHFKTILGLIALSHLFLASEGFAEELTVKKGRKEISVSLSGIGTTEFSDLTWGVGGKVSYGWFLRSWLKPEIEGYFDFIHFDPAFFGGILAGPLFYLNRGNHILPFGGLKLGFGVAYGGDGDGGTITTPTFTIAPKVGVLLLLSNRIGLQTHLEYQRVWILDDSMHTSNHHQLRGTVGLSFLF
jgi:hypothetical protein